MRTLQSLIGLSGPFSAAVAGDFCLAMIVKCEHMKTRNSAVTFCIQRDVTDELPAKGQASQEA